MEKFDLHFLLHKSYIVPIENNFSYFSYSFRKLSNKHYDIISYLNDDRGLIGSINIDDITSTLVLSTNIWEQWSTEALVNAKLRKKIKKEQSVISDGYVVNDQQNGTLI